MAKKKNKTKTSEETPPKPPVTERMMTPYGIVVTIIYLLLWLLPISWVGSTYSDVKFFPTVIKQQNRVACLFTNEARAWKTYHIQIQLGGSGEWVEMPLDDYFEMDIFGYRTRLHRLLSVSWRKYKGIDRTREMSNFVKTRYDKLNPDGPSLDAIRYIRAQHSVKHLVKENHVFRRKPLTRIHPNYWQIFGEVRWDGKRPQHGSHRMQNHRKKKQQAKPGAKGAMPKLKPLSPKGLGGDKRPVLSPKLREKLAKPKGSLKPVIPATPGKPATPAVDAGAPATQQ